MEWHGLTDIHLSPASVDEARVAVDPFDGLRRIGIDEISCKRGHRHLPIVVDHDTGRMVWAAKGHVKKTLGGFFRRDTWNDPLAAA